MEEVVVAAAGTIYGVSKVRYTAANKWYGLDNDNDAPLWSGTALKSGAIFVAGSGPVALSHIRCSSSLPWPRQPAKKVAKKAKQNQKNRERDRHIYVYVFVSVYKVKHVVENGAALNLVTDRRLDSFARPLLKSASGLASFHQPKRAADRLGRLVSYIHIHRCVYRLVYLFSCAQL